MDSRVLKYKSILLEKDDLVLSAENCVKPATSIQKGEACREEIEHCCLDTIDYQTKVRQDLKDTPLETGEQLLIDGSSRIIEGKRRNGYAIIDGGNWMVCTDLGTSCPKSGTEGVREERRNYLHLF